MKDKKLKGKVTRAEGGRLRVLVELDQDFAIFEPRVGEFLEQVAVAVGADPAAFQLVSVKQGCVLIEFDGPEEGLSWFISVINGDGDSAPPDISKRIHALQRDTKIKLIRRSGPGSAPAILIKTVDVTRVLDDAADSTSWLHLSDLHTYGADEGKHWGADLVSKALVDEIAPLLGKAGIAPKSLMFTGDLTHSGRVAQFAEVSRFIGAVRAQVKTIEQVYVVPGNHDVHRPGVRDEEALLKELDGVEAARRFMTSPEDEMVEKRRSANQRLTNFYSFVIDGARQGISGARLDELSFIQAEQYGTQTVSVAGLNTAWRCSSDLDKGRLILGEPQIEKARHIADSADLRIALSHHPLGSDWFTAWDRQYHRTRLSCFDIILHGHEHTPGSISATDLLNASKIVTIPAGAVYLPPADRNYYLSFNAVHINLTARRGCVWFWRFDRIYYRWVLDTAITEDGFVLFDLPGEGRKVSVSERVSN